MEKPSPAFFAELVALAGEPPRAIAYVGDRVDNDIVPAAEAGMVTIFVRRGPWGEVHAHWPNAARADVQVDDLAAAANALVSWGS